MKKTILAITALAMAALAQAGNGKPADFVPAGYRIFEEVKGDLNKDGLDDYVLIVKGTDRKNMIISEYCGNGDWAMDVNRRGIIIVFNWGDGYELALKNLSCLSSEITEEGCAYFTPELSVSIKNGNLYLKYDHGRYGHWSYTFRHQNSDFELIGYDNTYGAAGAVYGVISINFLSKRKLNKKNIYAGPENKAIFKESWENIMLKEPIKLRNISDLADLHWD